MDRFQDLVASIRRLKIEHSIPQGKRVPVSVHAIRYAGEVEEMRDAIAALARLESLELVDELPPPAGTARTITTAGIEVAVDLGASADPELERKRLEDKIREAHSEIKRAEGKLANGSFVAKAPAEVVDKERAKLDEHRNNLAKLEKQLIALGE